MKKTLKALTLVMLFASLFFACRPKSGIDVKVKESDDEFKFTAYFPEDKSDDVMRFIKRNVSADRVTELEKRSDVPIKLDDGTHFLMRSEPGEIVIRLNKDENSVQSLARMKRLCEGIKKEILN